MGKENMKIIDLPQSWHDFLQWNLVRGFVWQFIVFANSLDDSVVQSWWESKQSEIVSIQITRGCMNRIIFSFLNIFVLCLTFCGPSISLLLKLPTICWMILMIVIISTVFINIIQIWCSSQNYIASPDFLVVVMLCARIKILVWHWGRMKFIILLWFLRYQDLQIY